MKLFEVKIIELAFADIVFFEKRYFFKIIRYFDATIFLNTSH